MSLKPTIASYSGATYRLMRDALSTEMLDLIEQIVVRPTAMTDIDQAVLAELVEMHVLAATDHGLRLNTSIFMKEDIVNVWALASRLGAGLGKELLAAGEGLNGCSPEIKNLLGGIIGVSQGLSQVFRDQRLAVDWKSYTGRYAQAKVDFDQVCDTYHGLNPDWQNKSVLRGDRYTAVFIGSGGSSYQSIVSEISSSPAFRNHLLHHLTDAFGALLTAQGVDDGRVQTAQEMGFVLNGRPAPILVTKEIYHALAPTIAEISAASCQFYLDHLPLIMNCLRQTRCGARGVPPENMMMHFWRYCRRALAKELYAAGFLTDSVPNTGSITVFYDNEIEELRRQL